MFCDQKKRALSIVSLSAIGALLIGLSACSDDALRSALYDPYPKEQKITPPSSTEPDTTVTTGKEDDKLTHNIPASSDDQNDNSVFFGSPWSMELDNAEALFSESFHSIELLGNTTIEVPRLQLRVELTTTDIDEDKAERYLSGMISLTAMNLNGYDYKRRLQSVGDVISKNIGEQDRMYGEFQTSAGALVIMDVYRKASQSIEEARKNPWDGTLYLKLSNSEQTIRIGEIKGFVEPL